jgi:hypothetical protein
MRPRSAGEWREFWHHGGDAELRALLQEQWPPLRSVGDDVAGNQSERVALLLGSAAPPRALAAELGRIRAELGASSDPEADRAMAETVDEWFRARSR